MKPNGNFKVIGLMSGTSLDGVDIAFCVFDGRGDKWNYRIEAAETIPYSGEWKERLRAAESGSAAELALADASYGHHLGRVSRDFMKKYKLDPQFIASHGHTIFHRPDRRMTLQIGKGSAIAAETGVPVVCDFRTMDVALGGQGAPLVPIGDRLLFPGYDYCLNLGGFANISYEQDKKRIAFDVCPVNIVLNRLAEMTGIPYDKDGKLGKKGVVIPELLEKLNGLSYYHEKPPKSLGKEWVLSAIWPVIEKFPPAVPDLVSTFCEHIAIQIAFSSGKDPVKKILVTGGGAFNHFLLERMISHVAAQLIIPDPLTVNFKEALIFAFLGVLRWRNEVNVLASVTGASRDHSGGIIFLP